jgi:hypothetical protein
MSGFQPPPGQYQNYADNSQPYNSQPAGGASTYQQQQSYAGSVGGDSYAGRSNRSLHGLEERGTTTTTRRHDRLLLPSFPLSRLLVSSPSFLALTHLLSCVQVVLLPPLILVITTSSSMHSPTLLARPTPMAVLQTVGHPLQHSQTRSTHDRVNHT